jgi:predicted nucleic-acid-binding protein
MFLVDTNIILRYLLNDVPGQSEIARREMKSGDVIILTQVVAEVIYVLSKIYKVDRKDISENLLKIFSLENVVVENEEIVYFTVFEYGNSKLDFVDELLYANSRIRGIEVKTFDAGLQGKINLLRGVSL